MRILVTGAAGQLGRDVVLACQRAGDDVLALGRRELDVADRDAVLGCVLGVRPDAVIHAAAWTAVDACEADPDRALLTNGLAVRWTAEACRRAGAHLVVLSTDYVFSGDQQAPYNEWDDPDPRSVYGRSKLAGEHEAGETDTVVRTSWLCGEHGSNMVKTVLRLAGQPGEFAFVDDQRGRPTFTEDLAPMLRQLAVDRRPGVHHVTNQGAVTWFGFAQAVLAAAGDDPSRVRPIATADLTPPRAAPRPANSVLDNTVLRLSGLPLLPDFHDPLARLVTRLQD